MARRCKRRAARIRGSFGGGVGFGPVLVLVLVLVLVQKSMLRRRFQGYSEGNIKRPPERKASITLT